MNSQDLKHEFKATDVIEQFFPRNSNISMGTFARKAPFLMMKLAEITNKSWNSYTYYRPSSGRCETILSNDDGYVIIKHAFVNNGNLRNTKNVVDSVFVKDRWVKKPVTYSKVRLESNNFRAFIYEKTKYVRPENSIGITLLFKFSMSNAEYKLSWKDRFKRLFTKQNENETINVVNSEILDTSFKSMIPDDLLIDLLKDISYAKLMM